MQVAFTYDAVAVATVEATRKRGVCEGPSPPGAPPSGLPARDILLQHATGRLSLHIGSRHVCNVVVDAAGPSRLGPYAGLIGAEKPTETGETVFYNQLHFISHASSQIALLCEA